MRNHELNKVRKSIFTKILVAIIVVVSAIFVTLSIQNPVSADTGTYCRCANTYSNGRTVVEEGSETALFSDSNGCFCGGITRMIRIGLNIMTAGIAVLATVGIIWSGFLYLSARENEGQVATAKQRIKQVVIGIAAFGLFDVAMGLLLPGGAVSSIPSVVSSTSTRVKRDDLDVGHTPSKPEDPGTPPPSSSSPHQPEDPSDPSDPSDPDPGEDPSDPDPPSSDCSSYGVAKGTEYHTQYGSYKNVQWKGGTCPNCTINGSGCPMIAILNATIKVTNCKLTPKIFADHMKSYTNGFKDRKGLFLNNSEWSNTGGPILEHYAKHYKVNIKTISKGSVKTALQKGHAVIARGARGSNESNKVFSRNGHFVAFVGISGNTVHVKNPASSSFQNVSFETATQFATNYWEVWK